MTTQTDCLILGAGPAGSLAAILLQQRGWSVTLVGDGRRQHVITHETMLPNAQRRIEQMGLTDIFVELELFGCTRQEVLWGSDAVQVATPPPNERGFRVDRQRFDDAMRARARDLGVRVLDHHTVLGELPTAGHGHIAIVDTASPDPQDPIHVEAQTVLLATGRTPAAQKLALQTTAEHATGARTTALVFVGPVDSPLVDTTRVESHRNGWVWWLPSRGEECSVAMFLDSDELRARGSKDLLQETFAALTGPLPNSAKPSRGVDSTPRLLVPGAPIFTCGDAGSAIDPLSSQGLEKALASADTAACAVDAALRDRSQTEHALAWQRSWEHRLWLAHQSEAAGWYAREPRFVDAKFWRARRSEANPNSTRLSPSAALQPATTLERRTILERRGDRLQQATGFGLEGSPISLSAIGTVEIEPLLKLLDRPRTLEDLIRCASQDPHLFPLGPRAIAEAFASLLKEHLVVPARARG